MNNRERVLNILRHKKADRVPFMPLTTRTWFFSLPEYRKKFKPLWNEVGQYIPDVDYSLEMEEIEFRSKFYESIGVTFLQYGSEHGGNHIVPQENLDAGIKVKKIRNEEDNKFKFIYETPVGSLEQSSDLSKSASIAVRDHLIKNIDDYKVYKYILENQKIQWPELNSWSENVLKAIGDRGVAFANGPVPPLMVWVFTVLGVDGIAFGLWDHKKELLELVDLQHKMNMAYLDLIVKCPFEIIIADAVNGTYMTSPQIYKEQYVPFHQQYAKVLHENSKIYVSHSSGEPRGAILHDIEQTGLDGLYGFIYPVHPGEPELGKWCKMWEGKITVMGGIDPHLMATGTTRQISEKVKQIMDEVGDAPNFILGLADDTVYGTPVENLAEVPKTLDKLYS